MPESKTNTNTKTNANPKTPEPMFFRLKGRCALVTGSGAKRVGRAVAQRLAAAGCNIVLHANTSVTMADPAAQQIASEFGVKTHVVSGDLADGQVPQQLIDQTLQ
ncbi:MAG: SDR family NAD(P)-dependent oxidoreductase, partial [Planctomycetota bacterium]